MPAVRAPGAVEEVPRRRSTSTIQKLEKSSKKKRRSDKKKRQDARLLPFAGKLVHSVALGLYNGYNQLADSIYYWSVPDLCSALHSGQAYASISCAYGQSCLYVTGYARARGLSARLDGYLERAQAVCVALQGNASVQSGLQVMRSDRAQDNEMQAVCQSSILQIERM